MSKKRKTKRKNKVDPGFVIIGIGVAGLVLMGTFLIIDALRPSPLERTQTANLETGKENYEIHCASCHGIDGEGQNPVDVPAGQNPAPAHDATGHTWHHTDAQNFQTVKQGGPTAMPAYADTLTDQEIVDVLAYIKTFWGPNELQSQPR